jgi:hypothetical protein
MINKINKERRRLINATPIRTSNKKQWQEAQADPKLKKDRAQVSTDRLITQFVTDWEFKENKQMTEQQAHKAKRHRGWGQETGERVRYNERNKN